MELEKVWPIIWTKISCEPPSIWFTSSSDLWCSFLTIFCWKKKTKLWHAGNAFHQICQAWGRRVGPTLTMCCPGSCFLGPCWFLSAGSKIPAIIHTEKALFPCSPSPTAQESRVDSPGDCVQTQPQLSASCSLDFSQVVSLRSLKHNIFRIELHLNSNLFLSFISSSDSFWSLQNQSVHSLQSIHWKIQVRLCPSRDSHHQLFQWSSYYLYNKNPLPSQKPRSSMIYPTPSFHHSSWGWF